MKEARAVAVYVGRGRGNCILRKLETKKINKSFKFTQSTHLRVNKKFTPKLNRAKKN